MECLPLKRGDILKTPKFNEPVRVTNEPLTFGGFIVGDLLGVITKTYRKTLNFPVPDFNLLEFINIRQEG